MGLAHAAPTESSNFAELAHGQNEMVDHIADVFHFVQPNAKINNEAERKCTTVHVVTCVI
jgi:exoribonuclease R